MVSHFFGWLSLLGVIYATLLYFWNVLNPNQRETRINLHCNISKFTILTIGSHLLFQSLEGLRNQWVIWLGLVIYLIIMISGFVLMYVPGAGNLRYHARTVHSALLVGLGATLIQHVLTVLEIV
jgi:hypothetical protein